MAQAFNPSSPEAVGSLSWSKTSLEDSQDHIERPTLKTNEQKTSGKYFRLSHFLTSGLTHPTTLTGVTKNS